MAIADRPGLLRTHVEVDAERVDGDLLVLDVRFGDLDHAVHAVSALGPDAEAIAPPDLRDALAARADTTTACR